MESATSSPVTERQDAPQGVPQTSLQTDAILSQVLEDLDQVSSPGSGPRAPESCPTRPSPGSDDSAVWPNLPPGGRGEGSFWPRVQILAQSPGWLVGGASVGTAVLVWISLLLGLTDSLSPGALVAVVALVEGWVVYALLSSRRADEATVVTQGSGVARDFGSPAPPALLDPPFDQVLREVDRIATFLESVLDRHAFRIRDELRRRSSQLDDLRREFETHKRHWTLRVACDSDEEPTPSEGDADSIDSSDERNSPVPGYEKGTSPLSRASLARMERVAAELLEHLKITAQAIAVAEVEAVGDDSAESTQGVVGSESPLRSQIESLELLVRQLVELANLRTGASWSDISNVLLPDVFQDVRGELWEAARQHGVRISVRVADEAQEVHLDGGLLRRAIRELLGNAVSHAGNGGRVSVSATVDSDDDTQPKVLRIRVRDSGRGVCQKDRERIFRPWEIGRRFRESLTGCGLGLGLALARSCARRLGGELTLQTRRGKGSTFTLSVPLLYSEDSRVGSSPESKGRLS